MDLPDVARWALSLCDPELVPRSRMHRLQNIDNVWILREDESGFAYAAGKKRKYASLLPWLIGNHASAAILIGSEASNHVLAGAQLLREKGIEPFLLLKKSHSIEMLPNAFLSRMLVPTANIRLLSRDEWHTLDAITEAWKSGLKAEGRTVFSIPEGAFCAEALPGAMTLGIEIMLQEAEQGLQIDHIYMDSGSGLSAAALIHFFEAAGNEKQIHIFLAAGNAEGFEKGFDKSKVWLQKGWGDYPESNLKRSFLEAESGKFTGKLSAGKRDFILSFAREHGILLDPFYNAGLFSLALSSIAKETKKGNSLIIHSGGGLSLLGYPALGLED